MKKSDTPKVEEKPNKALTLEKGGNKFIRIRDYIDAKYDLRVNIISSELEVSLKGKGEYERLNEHDIIYELLELGETGVDKVVTPILKAGRLVKEYNPIAQYFHSLPVWEESQGDYITELANFVQTKDQQWFNSQFKKMLVRLVACALNIIPFNKQCFTLLSDQNDGKSSFFRFLCPPRLAEYYTENIDFINKDGRLALCQNLLINLDELANFTRADIKQVKAFISRENVKDRLPYDRRPRVFPRIASFVGSTNSDEFLTDETGNVRWLVHEVVSINHDNGGPRGYNANIDIDLVYSQAYTLLKQGFNFKMTKEEIAKSEANNKSYMVVSMEQELIQRTFTPGTKEDHDKFVTPGRIKTFIEKDTKGRILVTRVGAALKVLGFKRVTVYDKEKGYSVKGYYVKVFDRKELMFL